MEQLEKLKEFRELGLGEKVLKALSKKDMILQRQYKNLQYQLF